MADMTNSINEKILKNTYAGTGHPVKDKLLVFLEEVESNINVLNTSIGAVAGSSDITTLNSDVVILKSDIVTDGSDIDLINEQLSNVVAEAGGRQQTDPSGSSTYEEFMSTLVADTSNVYAILSNVVGEAGSRQQSDPATDSTFLNFMSTLVADVSNVHAVLSNIVGELAPRLSTNIVASTFGNFMSSLCADTSNVQADVSNAVGYMGGKLVTDPSASTLTAYLSTLAAEMKAVSDSYTATIPSDIDAVVSDLNLVEKTLSDIVAEAGSRQQTDPATDSTFENFMSTLVADTSNVFAILSNVVAEVGPKLPDITMSTFGNFMSTFVASSSNVIAELSNIVGEAGGRQQSDPAGASTYQNFMSTLVADVSNVHAVDSNIGATNQNRLETTAAAATLTSVVSQLVAVHSNLYLDLNDNVKSNVTVVEKSLSDAVGYMGGFFATDPDASTIESYLSAAAVDINNSVSNITAIEAQFSDLRKAMSDIVTKWASDVSAGLSGSDSCSDMIVTLSDFMAIISNALIAD